MVSLRAFKHADFEQLIAWITSEQALMQFAGPGFSFPLTAEQLTINLADPNRMSFAVLNTASAVVIGHAEIFFTGTATAHLCRIMIGENKHRGKGTGLLLVKKLLETCFGIMGISDVSLNVYDWNTGAIKCYAKAGFIVNEANTRTQPVAGGTWTTLNMRLSKNCWLENKFA